MKNNGLLQHFFIVLILTTVVSCNKKTESLPKSTIEKSVTEVPVSDTISNTISTTDPIEGTYTTKECGISLIISKTKTDYKYVLKTKLRTLKGKAVLSKNNSGEKYISLEGIKWDEYEGDISNEDESDSTADSQTKKDLEIPVGIDALYLKDTLTIQNYGNSMNYYTKISECGLKYIQLVKK
ncbi:hypothetical protein ACFSJW_24040 [Flavobacterium artemisiae]|uniref:Lipoprotein n=1 Tax=Flavobacterium artemisiae TaxID=2126556 RepID=A0ABW4HAT8_9FLAO